MKTTVTEMKNSLDGLIKRLDMVNKRISELEDISIETSQSEIQRKKDESEKKKKKPRTSNV